MKRAIRHTWTLMALVVCGCMVRGQTATLEPTFSLRLVDGIMTPFQNGIPVPTWEKQNRPMVSLAGTWRKQRFAADHNITMRQRDGTGYAALLAEATGRQLPSYDDGAWQTAGVPGVENTMNGYELTPETYEGGVWYRHAFTVPDSLQGKLVRLKFLAVNYVADVWLNGQYLGWHEGGYTPFAFDATASLRFDTVNVIAVRVDNIPWNPGHVPNPTYGFRNDIVPYYRCDWFNYTGIMHDVYLEFSDPVSVVRADVVPTSISGDLTTTITVSNTDPAPQQLEIRLQVYTAHVDSSTVGSEVTSQLVGTAVSVTGTTVATLDIPADSVRVWRTAIAVPNPELWSPRHPHLYVLRVTTSVGGVVRDELYTQFGIRTVGTSGSTFLFNNRPLFMPGIARHEDHPVFGRSIPASVILNDLRKIKTLNVSLVRTAHYPNNPFTYLVADRLGLAIMEEIPVWWFDTDEVWTIQNSVRHIHTQMWREMVFKDYNRPSVILWSTCNECLNVPGRQTFIASVRNDLHTNYPDGRLVSQSAAADRPGPGDASQDACDVAGWTMYFGIFHGGSYYAGTQQFLQQAHAAHPSRPVLDTEFGYWSGESGGEQGTQVNVFNFTFLAFSEVTIRNSSGEVNPNGFLMGTTWWCAFDWFTSQQSPPDGFQSMGIFHMDRLTPKTVAPVLVNTYAPYFTNSELTAVDEPGPGATPSSPGLKQNYPNPFNPMTNVEFSIVHAADISLKVYDVLGSEITTLVQETRGPGTYEAVWDATGVPGGVYFCRLIAGGLQSSIKMLVLK